MIKTKARLITVTSVRGLWLHLTFLSVLIPLESVMLPPRASEAIAQLLTAELSIVLESPIPSAEPWSFSKEVSSPENR